MRRAIVIRTFSSAALVMLCCGQHCTAAEKVQYAMRFEAGKKYHLKKVIEQKVTRVIQGTEQTVQQMTKLGSNFNVQDVEQNGSAWIDYTYTESALKLKGPGVDVDFDSAKTDKPVPLQAIGLALILGESFYVKMSPAGRVEKINGLESVLSSVRGKIPNVRGKEQILESMKQQLDESRITSELESFFAIYPDRAVSVGDSWSRRHVFPGPNGRIVETKWQLKQADDAVVRVQVSIELNSNPDAGPVNIRGVKMQREISGSGTGLIEINRSTGMIIRSKLTQDIVEQLRRAPGGAIRRSRTAGKPVKTHSVITFEVTEQQTQQKQGQTAPDK